MKHNRAAVYLRSSKDRSDVSLDAQRRALQELANNRQPPLAIVKEYADAVESGKDEFRPAFLTLHQDLADPRRGWDYLLLLDTSRLARRGHIASVFEHRAEKNGVTVIYKNLPESDPITQVVVKGLFRALDEYHSLISKQKGLAGMAENVMQGYRAGGCAPRGYKLRAVETGAVRNGERVTKSVLEPDTDAPIVKKYLELRAGGMSRKNAMKGSGLQLSQASAVDMERKALTYAGHTVWNMSNEKLPEGGYKTGVKLRPRDEWLVKENTHTALITTVQAEALLEGLESRKQTMTRNRGAGYLLTGLLKMPDGTRFDGMADKRTGRYYRSASRPAKLVRCEKIDGPILQHIIQDMKEPGFLFKLTQAIRERAKPPPSGHIKALKAELSKVESSIEKSMTLAIELEDPAPALRQVDTLEKKRKELAGQIALAELEQRETHKLAGITESDVAALLDRIAGEISSGELPPDELRDVLKSFISHIEIDPHNFAVRVYYRFEMASPCARESKQDSRFAVAVVQEHHLI